MRLTTRGTLKKSGLAALGGVNKPQTDVVLPCVSDGTKKPLQGKTKFYCECNFRLKSYGLLWGIKLTQQITDKLTLPPFQLCHW